MILWIAKDEYDAPVSTEICTEEPTFKLVPEEGVAKANRKLSINGGGKRMIVRDDQLKDLFGLEPLKSGEKRCIRVTVEEVR